MKRRPRDLPTCLTLLALAATLALWAGSYGFPFRRGWTDPRGTTWFVGSGGGALHLSRQTATANVPNLSLQPLALTFDTSRFGVVALRDPFGQAGLSNLDLLHGNPGP